MPSLTCQCARAERLDVVTELVDDILFYFEGELVWKGLGWVVSAREEERVIFWVNETCLHDKRHIGDVRETGCFVSLHLQPSCLRAHIRELDFR